MNFRELEAIALTLLQTLKNAKGPLLLKAIDPKLQRPLVIQWVVGHGYARVEDAGGIFEASTVEDCEQLYEAAVASFKHPDKVAGHLRIKLTDDGRHFLAAQQREREREAVAGIAISSKPANILVALLSLDATSELKKRTRENVAKVLYPNPTLRMAGTDLRTEFGKLSQEGFTAALTGKRGGVWLTAKGTQAAHELETLGVTAVRKD